MSDKILSRTAGKVDTQGHGCSDEDTLDFIQADRIVGAVIELGRERRAAGGDS
jgi:hypothetical protein